MKPEDAGRQRAAMKGQRVRISLPKTDEGAGEGTSVYREATLLDPPDAAPGNFYLEYADGSQVMVPESLVQEMTLSARQGGN